MNDLFSPIPCTKVGEANGRVLGLIADRRITRADLNRDVKAGIYPDLHHPLIAFALDAAGIS